MYLRSSKYIRPIAADAGEHETRDRWAPRDARQATAERDRRRVPDRGREFTIDGRMGDHFAGVEDYAERNRSRDRL